MAFIDLTAAVLDIRIAEGADLSKQFAIETSGDPQDITGWTWAATLKPAGETLIELTVTVDDAESGLFTVSKAAAGLATVAPGGVHYWALWRTDTNQPYLLGTVVVQADPLS